MDKTICEDCGYYNPETGYCGDYGGIPQKRESCKCFTEATERGMKMIMNMSVKRDIEISNSCSIGVAKFPTTSIMLIFSSKGLAIKEQSFSSSNNLVLSSLEKELRSTK